MIAAPHLLAHFAQLEASVLGAGPHSVVLIEGTCRAKLNAILWSS